MSNFSSKNCNLYTDSVSDDQIIPPSECIRANDLIEVPEDNIYDHPTYTGIKQRYYDPLETINKYSLIYNLIINVNNNKQVSWRLKYQTSSNVKRNKTKQLHHEHKK
jgi:hypothetical protein